MDLNKKIAKILFWVLVGIIIFQVIWDFIFTYLFLKNNPNVYESNPVHAFFVNLWGTNYFLFSIPIILLILFGAIKFGAWLITKCKNGELIKGDNHIAILLILLMAPNIVHQLIQIIFRTRLLEGGFKFFYFLGLIMMIIYLTLTEYDLWISKKKEDEKDNFNG